DIEKVSSFVGINNSVKTCILTNCYSTVTSNNGSFVGLNDISSTFTINDCRMMSSGTADYFYTNNGTFTNNNSVKTLDTVVLPGNTLPTNWLSSVWTNNINDYPILNSFKDIDTWYSGTYKQSNSLPTYIS